MYSETKQLIMKQDGGIEAEVYFDTIEEQFKTAEDKYLKAKKHKEETTARILKERAPKKEGGDLKEATKSQQLELSEATREAGELGKLYDNATQTYGAALNVKFAVEDAIQKEQYKMEVELPPKTIASIDSTVEYLYEDKNQLVKMVKF